MNKEEIRNRISELVTQYYGSEKRGFVPGKTRIGVGAPVYDDKEVMHVIDSLFSGWISQSRNVADLERDYAAYHGVKYAVALNSGSSANLIALLALIESGKIKQGSEVIVPATTFPTVASPIIQLGLKPVFVDVDGASFNLDPEAVRSAITAKTSVIMPAHFLGYPADMEQMVQIAREHSLHIIEDCCEAHGARFRGKLVGTFGDMGTYSFFVAHNITCGEGGMIITDNAEYYELARSLRAFGRACTCPICLVTQGKPCKLRDFHDPVLANYNIRQVFLRLGYALKMTEMQAAFCIEQLKKLDNFNSQRTENAEFYTEHIRSGHLQLPAAGAGIAHAYYGYAIVIRKDAPFSRDQFVKHLEDRRVETRPFFGGSLPDQPAFRNQDIKIAGKLPNSDWVRDYGVFIGCHPGIGKEERQYVVDVIRSFTSQY
ncbi:MAG: aminotransferase class I/II-fold pyridoxal phosphate-dependent enzyme [archaeon]